MREWTRVERYTVVGPGGRRRVLAKAYRDGAGRATRPGLSLPDDRLVKHGFEAAALVAGEQAVAAADDPGLTAVRLLAHLPEERTLIQEELDAVELRDLLAAPAGAGSPDPAEAACAAAGRWLALLHGLEPAEPSTLRATRSEVIAALDRLAHALAEDGAGGAGRLADRAAAVLAARLPEHLAMGLGHGDCAPRNVLVTPDGRVAWFDIVGRHRIPRIEDLAYFTVAVQTSAALRVAGLRSRRPRRLERSLDAFLTGYATASGVAVDRDALRAYRLVILFDRWLASRHRPGRARAAVESAAVAGLIRRELHRLDAW